MCERVVADHVVRCADRNDLTAAVAAFRAEVDQPVGRRHDIHVVLDDHQRVPGREQLAERAHQLGDVVEVQAGGRLVEQEQRAAGGRFAAGGVGEEAGELQALGLAAGERRHGLSELHVLEADVGQRRQHARDLRILDEERQRFADSHLEHVGDVRAPALPLDHHLQRFGTETLAVAVRAAQVHVGQELHLHVLEAVAAAGGTATVARVERERARRVAALPGEPRLREDRADALERADVTRRIAPRRLADRRLVDEHGVVEPVVAEQAIELSRGFRRLALRLDQRGVEHVLDQRRLAAPRNPGDAHQAFQRDLDVDRLQVVLARALQHEPGCVRRHVQRTRGVDAEAAAEIAPGERGGLPQFVGRAVEDDLAAAFARPRPHVDHTVGREHDLRIVLDDDQRVAGVAQPVHHLHHAVHVARMQPDRRFVEHEQRVHERRAERGREVDALHFAAREGAALPVEGQVAQADIDEEGEPRTLFVEQHFSGFVERRRQGHAVEEAFHAFDRQQHQVVQDRPGSAWS